MAPAKAVLADCRAVMPEASAQEWLDATLPVTGPLLRGFATLRDEAWSYWRRPPKLELPLESSMNDTRRLFVLWEQLQRVTAERPTLRAFWKDTSSVFLGATPGFAEDAGVSLPALIGLQDTDDRLAWSRQGLKYQRDDRQTMTSRTPRLNFLERQDAPNGTTKWLLTSKVPLMEGSEVVGLLGSYDVLDAEELRELSKRGVGLS